MNIADAGVQIEPSLDLPEDEVQLWRVDLDAIRGDESRWQKLLSSDECKRAARFHFERDRQRFVASRAWLRMIAAGYLVADAKELTFSYSEKEKPSLGASLANSGLNFNISHSSGIALLAFTRRRDIGVDVEQIRRDFDVETIARRFFSKYEQERVSALPPEQKVEAFYRCWTRKEAYVKATGDGLSLPLSQFDVSIEDGETDALLATRPDGSEAGQWRLMEVPAGSKHIAAVCVRGRDWKLNAWS